VSDARLPVEVELVYEVMPCNAMRTAQEPGSRPHPCSYFRKWGAYHSYDYEADGPPAEPGIVHKAEYVGAAPALPEILSGCRKAPIMALGINPNLPGWWAPTRQSVMPLFDDYRQYAHYFRYRSIAKLELRPADYRRYGGGPDDLPTSRHDLEVPLDQHGHRTIRVRLQRQKMYEAYQSLLDSLAAQMGWKRHALTVGEDLSYANMVACPSAKWTTVPVPADPAIPPMTDEERDGIVTECFRHRRYLLRQLFQSLPAVLVVFGQTTANAVLNELGSRLTPDPPAPGEPLTELMTRQLRLVYGTLSDGSVLDAAVIFSPHVTGNPQDYRPARAHVVDQLVAQARAGHLRFSRRSGHLARPAGSCVFCPMLAIGVCDYANELRPLPTPPTLELAADSGAAGIEVEKATQEAMMRGIVESAPPVGPGWTLTDETSSPEG
jgi:hypothetical protein